VLKTILTVSLVALLLVSFLLLILLLVRLILFFGKLAPILDNFAQGAHPLVRREVSSFLDNLQDAIEDGEETEEYSEIEVNPGKFRVLHGRLKGICRRLDNFSKGYLLSSLVHSGLSNNPFVLEELDLSGALCTEEQFIGADLSRLVARGINFKGAILSEARLENARMSFAVLSGARLDDIKMSGAYLNEAEMQSCYLKGADLQRAYLIGTDLRQSYLGEANLDATILRQANLEGANLTGCHMYATNLSEVNLFKSIIRDANLQNATLSEANLEGAYLAESDFDSADLWKTNMTKTILLGTNFQSAYLKDAKFFGHFKDLVECNDNELDKLQDKNLVGLYSSAPDDRFGISKPTNFYKSQWWQAEFDYESAQTLWKYMNSAFAPPNGLELTEADWESYREAEKKINEILVLKGKKKSKF
jgi:uncharacterized protein YjbI with pentapeptide repeats